jgi:hypothetical protein
MAKSKKKSKSKKQSLMQKVMAALKKMMHPSKKK